MKIGSGTTLITVFLPIEDHQGRSGAIYLPARLSQVGLEGMLTVVWCVLSTDMGQTGARLGVGTSPTC